MPHKEAMETSEVVGNFRAVKSRKAKRRGKHLFARSGKIEAGETPQEALVREIREELETEIAVGELIDTIEYDYPTFHLSMDCFWAEIVSGNLVLKEHEAAKWLTRDELDTVEWLPADVTLISGIKLML